MAKNKNKARGKVISGKVIKTRGGCGYLTPAEEFGMAGQVYIAVQHMKDAMSGDVATAELLPQPLWAKGPEAFITQVTERAFATVVGTLEITGQSGFLIPISRELKEDIYVPKNRLFGAKNGDKVRVEIKKYPKDGRLAEGAVAEIIARANDPEALVKSVLADNNIIEEFPAEVYKEINSSAWVYDEANRLDLRNEHIITIDGAHSKDLDDAISLKILENGNYQLGVHIADVSFFVDNNSALDEEALRRGNSIYLINYVVPMLPKILSNNLCSLAENEDKFTLSCIMEIDKEGNVLNSSFSETIIRSSGRLVYDDVSDLIEYNLCDKGLEPHKEMIMEMARLAAVLRGKREGSGSIDFDLDEAEFEIDEKGIPVEVFPSERRTANHLIEEFMLCANKAVAEHFFWMNYPFIYRVHEKPSPEKIVELKSFLRGVGISLPLNEGNLHPTALNKVLDEAEKLGKLSLVNSVMVKAMQKAYYSPQCLGHYGLAFKHYCHFTSPIRRYADLFIHRVIKKSIKEEFSEQEMSSYFNKAALASQVISLTERKALQMERRVEKIMKARFMEQWIGCEAKGTISGVMSFGFFVRLENTVEGLVPIDSLYDDYYILDKNNYRLQGESTGKTYSLGDNVNIVVVGVDAASGEIDFKMA